MSTNNFIIGSDLELAIVINDQRKQMHVYVKDSMYFASYHSPSELNALSIDISEWKVISLVVSNQWLANGLGITPEKMIARIVTSFNVAGHNTAANSNLCRIFGEHPDLPKEKQMNIPQRADVTTFAENMESMNKAFKRIPEAETVLDKHWFANDFKAIIEHANAHNDSIVYSYTKDGKQFFSFFSDLGDVVKDNTPIVVATWLPGWSRRAWNTADASFVNDINKEYPRIGQSIYSLLGLLAQVTLSGITQPVPLESNPEATVRAAEKIVEGLGKNVFGFGGMPMTAENAPPTVEELKKAGYLPPPFPYEPSLKANNSSISGAPCNTEEVKPNKRSLGLLNMIWVDMLHKQLQHGEAILRNARTSPNKSMGETEFSQMYPKSFSGYNIGMDTMHEQIKDLAEASRARAKEQETKFVQEHLKNIQDYLQKVKQQKESEMSQEQFRQSFTQFIDVFTASFPKTDTVAALKKMLIDKAVARFIEENKGKDKPVETAADDHQRGFTFRADNSGVAVLQLATKMANGSPVVVDATVGDLVKPDNEFVDSVRCYLDRTFNFRLDVNPFSGKIVAWKQCPINGRTTVSHAEMMSLLFDPKAQTTPKASNNPVSQDPANNATDGGVNEKPEEVTKETLPQLSTLMKLLDPTGDGAGIIDLEILHYNISKNPSLLDKDYYLYTFGTVNFISDRGTVGCIYDEDGVEVGNLLTKAVCMRMKGSELSRQHVDNGFYTEIEDLDDLVAWIL